MYSPNGIEELQIQVNSNLLKELTHRIAMSLITEYKDDIVQAIKDQVVHLMTNDIIRIKSDIIEEITKSIRLSNQYQTQQELKQKLRKELKDDLKKSIEEKFYPQIKSYATEKISSVVASDIKTAVKKHFSKELIDEYKDEMTSYFIKDLRKSLGEIATTIKPVIIDKTYEFMNKESLPVELSLMRNVYRYKYNNVKMSAPSGIYYLYLKGKLQYIGKATYVTGRINDHIDDKDFDEAYFFPIPISDLDHVETYLITLHNPPINKQKGMTIYRDLNNIPSSIYRDEKSDLLSA